MRYITVPLLAAILATPLTAAVHADFDVATLRATAPELIAALPHPPRADRVEKMLAERFNFSPRRDVQRVVIDGEGPGQPPVLHLTGCPATAIAAELSKTNTGETVPAGRLLLLPKPGAGFIALDADEALIGPVEVLRTIAKPTVDAPASRSPIALTWTPGPHVPEDLAGVTGLDLAGNGQGTFTGTITCTDARAASECERRIGVFRAMIDLGANGKLPKALELKPILDATTVTRAGASLMINAQIPAAVRTKMLERLAVMGHGNG